MSTFFFKYLDVDGIFIGICLEGYLYGKILVLCALKLQVVVPLSNEIQLLYRCTRTLFRNIRHVFKMPMGQVQEANHRFIRSLSSLRSIYSNRRE